MRTNKVETIDKFAVLQEIPIFNGVPVEQLWVVAEKARLAEHSDRSAPVIIQEDDTPAAHFYVLMEGVTALCKGDQEIKTMTEGAYYGENELIAGREKYCHTIRLISPYARFIKVSRKLFLTLFDSVAEMSADMCRLLSDKYLNNTEQLAREMEKSRNVDLIINRFDKVSSELLKSIGREEVEQKFLLKEDFDSGVFDRFGLRLKKVEIEQAYLRIEKEEEERIRKFGNVYYRTTKAKKSDSSREEKEEPIKQEDYERDMKKIKGKSILKTRYQVQNHPEFKEVCVDIFQGKLKPLKVAEIEYWTQEDLGNLEIPVWLKQYIKEDITTDSAYKNKNLALKGLPKR